MNIVLNGLYFILILRLIINNPALLNRCDNIRGNGTRKRNIRGIRKFRARRRSDSDASQDSSLETSIEDDEEEINENMDEDDDDESDIKNASSESGGMCDIGAANRTRNSNKINSTSHQSTYKLRDSRFVNIILVNYLRMLKIINKIINHICG